MQNESLEWFSIKCCTDDQTAKEEQVRTHTHPQVGVGFPVTRPPSHPCQHTTPPSLSWLEIGSLFDVTGVLFSDWWIRVTCNYSILIIFDIYITWYITIWYKMQWSEFNFIVIKILLLYWLICGCFYSIRFKLQVSAISGTEFPLLQKHQINTGAWMLLDTDWWHSSTSRVQRKFSVIQQQQHPRWIPFLFSWWCWWRWWEWLLPRVTYLS